MKLHPDDLQTSTSKSKPNLHHNQRSPKPTALCTNECLHWPRTSRFRGKSNLHFKAPKHVHLPHRQSLHNFQRGRDETKKGQLRNARKRRNAAASCRLSVKCGRRVGERGMGIRDYAPPYRLQKLVIQTANWFPSASD